MPFGSVEVGGLSKYHEIRAQHDAPDIRYELAAHRRNEKALGYDIVGDIHGQADKLEALLQKLGYRNTNGAWRHPDRQIIFVGDFIDRGPAQIRSILTARRMVEEGSALAVMGNHELNAIAWHTPDPKLPGEYLRPHFSEKWGKKNRAQHAEFLGEVEDNPKLHAEIIDWFLTLPLWVDLPGLRVVHACWHAPFMTWLSPLLHEGRYLTRDLMVAATDEPKDPEEKDNSMPSIFKAVEALTKASKCHYRKVTFLKTRMATSEPGYGFAGGTKALPPTVQRLCCPMMKGQHCRTRLYPRMCRLKVRPFRFSSDTTGLPASPRCNPTDTLVWTTVQAEADPWWPIASMGSGIVGPSTLFGRPEPIALLYSSSPIEGSNLLAKKKTCLAGHERGRANTALTEFMSRAVCICTVRLFHTTQNTEESMRCPP